MTEPQTIPVHEPRLRSLERDHTHLEQIQAAGREVAEKKKTWQDMKDELTKAKKDLDVAQTALLDLVEGGPPKEDPQRKLPFVEEPEPVASAPESAKEPEAAEILIPADIASLAISDGVKKALVNAGAKSVADVVDIGNKNWKQYPKGFTSIDGIGPKAVTKLAQILPSSVTAPDTSKQVETKRIKLLSFSAACPNLEPGKEYEATILEDGAAVVQLPGTEPVQFYSHEFELAEA